MLRGIDVSSWQDDIQVQNMPVDFVIVKATEGTSYVNPFCDAVVQRCISSDKLWGFYHFAKNGDPIKEADFFVDHTVNYFNHGIPVLDWEENQSVEWVNAFIGQVYERTGVRCWVYGNAWRFAQGIVNREHGRWVPMYPPIPNPPLNAELGNPPEVDGLLCCWQFASDGRVDGYDGDLDLNVFYGDKTAWLKYAGAVDEPNSNTTVLENDRFTVAITEKR